MNLQYLDLPFIFSQTEPGFDFIYALNDMGQVDIEIFDLKCVQVLIDGHLAYWEHYNFYWIGLPLSL